MIVIVLSAFIGLLFGPAFYQAYKIDKAFAENKEFFNAIESDPTVLEHIGYALSYEPVLRNRTSGTIFHKTTNVIVGTKLSLVNGSNIGVRLNFDSINLPVEVRKTQYKNDIVYCLVSENMAIAKCGFELKLNTF